MLSATCTPELSNSQGILKTYLHNSSKMVTGFAKVIEIIFYRVKLLRLPN